MSPKLGFDCPLYDSARAAIKIGYNKYNRFHDYSIFERKILKFIPSSVKKRECKELINGFRVRRHEILYYSYFVMFPNSTINELARDFQIHRDSAGRLISSFVEQNYLKRSGTGQGPDPFLHNSTILGMMWFKANFNFLKIILEELNRNGYYKRCFKRSSIKHFERINSLRVS